MYSLNLVKKTTKFRIEEPMWATGTAGRLQMEIVRHRFSPMQASGWFSDEQEPLQEWIYISNIYGDMLASPNGLLGFSPTFYPQKSSILTEVMGEDKKTLTVFSSLTKIL